MSSVTLASWPVWSIWDRFFFSSLLSHSNNFTDRCVWKKHLCNSTEDFTTVLTDIGLCYTFNAKEPLLKVTKKGMLQLDKRNSEDQNEQNFGFWLWCIFSLCRYLKCSQTCTEHWKTWLFERTTVRHGSQGKICGTDCENCCQTWVIFNANFFLCQCFFLFIFEEDCIFLRHLFWIKHFFYNWQREVPFVFMGRQNNSGSWKLKTEIPADPLFKVKLLKKYLSDQNKLGKKEKICQVWQRTQLKHQNHFFMSPNRKS